MPRYVVTSDWHIQNTGKFAKPTAGGLTTRAEYTFEFIEWLWDFCEKENIEKILHCGDMFTQRGLISAPLYNRFWDLLTDAPVDLIMIVGNHDRYRTDPSIHGMYVLGEALEHVTILHNQVLPLKDIRVAGCTPPFDMSEVRFKLKKDSKRNILLIHENIIGAEYESGSKADTGLSLKHLTDYMRSCHFNICFCGDIHVPQEMTAWEPQIVVVGAPLQMNFGDRDQKRGIWVYESDSHTLEFIAYENGPKFVQITDEDFEAWGKVSQTLRDRDFFQFKLKSVEKLRDLQEWAKTTKWTAYETQLVSESSNGDFSVSDLYDVREVIPAYVNEQEEDVSTQVRLRERGMNYINRVLEDEGA